MKTPRASPQQPSLLGLWTLLMALDVTMRLLEKTATAGTMQTHTTWVLSLLRQPWWWVGLALGPLQLWTWLRILARTELSVAYPLSSLSYPLTMIAAWLVFHEHLGYRVWVGGLFLTVGAALVGHVPRQPVVLHASPLSRSSSS